MPEAPTPPAAPIASRTGPTPLQWGTSRERLVLGLALIFGGGLGLQGTSPYILWLLLLGAVLHGAGWAVLPAAGWRRVVGGLTASVVAITLLTGPQSLWLLALGYAGWLLVRERSPLAWSTVLLPLVSGIVLALSFREYEQMPLALAIQLVVVTASAWLSAVIAESAMRRRPAHARLG